MKDSRETITVRDGRALPFAQVAEKMDKETALHVSRSNPHTPQAFYDAYVMAHAQAHDGEVWNP